MEKLENTFRRDGLLYTFIDRNDNVALYGVGGTYTDKILHYEVDIIYVRNDRFGLREAIPSNEQFGRDRSRCFNTLEEAMDYYDQLTFKIASERLKVVSGVEQNSEVISEPQLAM